MSYNLSYTQKKKASRWLFTTRHYRQFDLLLFIAWSERSRKESPTLRNWLSFSGAIDALLEEGRSASHVGAQGCFWLIEVPALQGYGLE